MNEYFFWMNNFGFSWMNKFFEWIILDFFWMNEIFEWIICVFFWMNKFFEWIILLYDWMNYWMNNKKCIIHKKNEWSVKKKFVASKFEQNVLIRACNKRLWIRGIPLASRWKVKLQDFLTKSGLFQDNFSYFTLTYFTSNFE